MKEVIKEINKIKYNLSLKSSRGSIIMQRDFWWPIIEIEALFDPFGQLNFRLDYSLGSRNAGWELSRN